MRSALGDLAVAAALVLAGWRGLVATEIHDAVKSGNVSKVVRVLRIDPAAVRKGDRISRTPLHVAVLEDNLGIVQLLLRAKAPVDAKDQLGYTPLHAAAMSTGKAGKRAAIAALLIGSGAQVDARSTTLETPLHKAAYYGRTDVVKLLIANAADVSARAKHKQSPLHDAARSSCSGVADAAKLLLANGAPADIQDAYGWAPIHLAAKYGNMGVMRVMIQARVDVNAKDGAGMTALHHAVSDADKSDRRERNEILKMLLQARADFAVKDKQGRTPLAIARKNGVREFTKVLQMAGARE